ncbi:uncharacterized protein M6B38_297225 [Iris pallida]|uniref:Mitochondrial import inner membrane translocase subunit TIM50 n=1 Tax=Iris pallida TaxID=29817 RepID=A0AAX6HQK4_IRIPA|nr:uncharacterized protein M6B38_297225 [Iris pallida]
MEDTVSAIKEVTSNTTCKLAEMVQEDCLISANSNSNANGKDPETSLQGTDQSSADVSSLLSTETDTARKCEDSFNKDPNLFGKIEEGISGANPDFAKHSHMTDSNSSETPKICKRYSRRRVKKKSSETKIEPRSSLPVAQESIDGNTSSLSSIAKSGSSRKISDGTFVGDCSMSSGAIDNSALVKNACTYSDNSNMLDEASSKLKAVKSNSKGDGKTENKGKDKVLGCSQHSLELDQNNLSGTKIPSEGGVSTLLGEEKVEAVTESSLVMDVDSKDSSMLKRADPYFTVDPSIQIEGGTRNHEEGNQKAVSTYCRESPSIRGAMHDSGTLDQLNKKIGELYSSKEEPSFSFQKLEAGKPEAGLPDLERALLSPRKKKLLVLDLNGLLADIITDSHNAHKTQNKISGKAIFKRPFCDEFINFCFEKFDVGVWSSRKRYNVDCVVDFLLGDSKHKLLFCWDQSKCTYTGFNTLENRYKPLVLKELKKLWNKEGSDLPWEKGDYSPSNTLLVDDSPYKALCNPKHTAIFPQPFRFDDEKDNSLGKSSLPKSTMLLIYYLVVYTLFYLMFKQGWKETFVSILKEFLRARMSKSMWKNIHLDNML